ncbi:hypothetical protein GCM10025858_10970 [Alicyclobacillus sacchari]|nr:hypothetical protein GCM10025858_10970 [Alicyclobacillus sacchari]
MVDVIPAPISTNVGVQRQFDACARVDAKMKIALWTGVYVLLQFLGHQQIAACLALLHKPFGHVALDDFRRLLNWFRFGSRPQGGILTPPVKQVL